MTHPNESRIVPGVVMLCLACGPLSSIDPASHREAQDGRLSQALDSSSIAIDASSTQGVLMNPTAYGNFGWLAWTQKLYSDADRSSASRLGLECVRVFLKIEQVGTNYPVVYPYLDAAAGLARGADGVTGNADGCLLLSLNGEGSVSKTEGGNCSAGCLTQAQYRDRLRGLLADLKARYAGIRYVEALNESEASVPSAANYYAFYRSTYQAVNAVNAQGLPGPALQPGGPTCVGFDVQRIQAFLDAYESDATPDKRLGFISHHMYWHQTDPKAVLAERATLNGLLGAGLQGVPLFIDELGIVPANPAADFDFLNNAAGTFATASYYAQTAPSAADGGVTFTAAWEIEGKLEETQAWSLMDHDYPGIFTPLGMYHELGSMLVAGERVLTTPSSDLLDVAGIGVNCLASVNSVGTVTALCANYQNHWQRTFAPTFVFSGLKQELGTRPRVRRWLLDATHSNSRVTGNQTTLEQVEDSTAAVVSGSLSWGPVPLTPNAMTLLEIGPGCPASGCSTESGGTGGTSGTAGTSGASGNAAESGASGGGMAGAGTAGTGTDAKAGASPSQPPEPLGGAGTAADSSPRSESGSGCRCGDGRRPSSSGFSVGVLALLIALRTRRLARHRRSK